MPLVLFWLKSSTAVTSAAKARVLNSIFFVYGAQIPYDTMNILLGLVFAVQNPMLPLVVLIAFLTGSCSRCRTELGIGWEQKLSGLPCKRCCSVLRVCANGFWGLSGQPSTMPTLLRAQIPYRTLPCVCSS